jgi:hypothetical protein
MHDIESLTRRVERLERSNFILKIVNAGVVAAVVAVVQLPSLLALTSPVKVVTAQKFNLATAGGILLASLGPSPGGSALTFYDSGGHATVAVGMQADGVIAGIETFDGNTYVPGLGKTRAIFGEANTDANGGGIGLGIFDPSGKVRLTLGTKRDASTGSSLALYDAGGNLRSGVDVDFVNNFTGLFTIYSNTKTSSSFGATLDDNSAGGFVNDHNGTLRTSLEVVATNSFTGNGAYVWDKNAALRNGLEIDETNNFSGVFSKYAVEPNPLDNSILLGSTVDTSVGPFLGVYDSSNTLRSFIGFGGNTWPAVVTLDSNGTTRAGFSTDNVHNFNGFFDYDGNKVGRYYAGSVYDGSSDFVNLDDATNNGAYMAGNLRVWSQADAFASSDEGIFLFSPSNKNEAFLFADPGAGGGTMQTFDTTGTQTGHVP